LFGEKEDKKVRNLVVPSNQEGESEVEARDGCTCSRQTFVDSIMGHVDNQLFLRVILVLHWLI
jgi:hypothetical protein